MGGKPAGQDEAHRKLAIAVVQKSSDEERVVLLSWAERLIEIRSRPGSVVKKIREAISTTYESKAIWPLIKFLGSEIKRLGWDERGIPARMALVAAAAVAAVVGPKAAGLAAFGGAVAVPMWVLFGAGAAFLGVLIEEIRKKSGNEKSRRIIDVEPVHEEQQKRSVRSRKRVSSTTARLDSKASRPRTSAK